MTLNEYNDLTILKSSKQSYPSGPDHARLETFPNRYPSRNYIIRFDCPEFTSVCPITGQPDFAQITIIYVPNARCIESKSLKLYLFSYRNTGMFHEEITNRVLDDMVEACSPRWARVLGIMNPRGGIGIKVAAEFSEPGFDKPSFEWIS
ncbi:MAG: preQ(1) synthase [Desulfomonilaceae bacterium]|jgi:7-cyano-7-deazaguanine reductase